MPAHRPRRLFSKPFVVTIAAIAAGMAGCVDQPAPQAPPTQPATVIQELPVASATANASTVSSVTTPVPTADPLPSAQPPPAPANAGKSEFVIAKSNDGTCVALTKAHCGQANPDGPPTTCNPPPPRPVKCPAEVVVGNPLLITKYASSGLCFVAPPPGRPCPMGARCNPPPPQPPKPIACPL